MRWWGVNIERAACAPRRLAGNQSSRNRFPTARVSAHRLFAVTEKARRPPALPAQESAMSSPASRSASSESIALRSVAASLTVLLGVVFIAACSSQRTRGSDVAQTEPDPNLPAAPSGQAKSGEPDSAEDEGVRIARRASADLQTFDSSHVVLVDAMQRDMAGLSVGFFTLSGGGPANSLPSSSAMLFQVSSSVRYSSYASCFSTWLWVAWG